MGLAALGLGVGAVPVRMGAAGGRRRVCEGALSGRGGQGGRRGCGGRAGGKER